MRRIGALQQQQYYGYYYGRLSAASSLSSCSIRMNTSSSSSSNNNNNNNNTWSSIFSSDTMSKMFPAMDTERVRSTASMLSQQTRAHIKNIDLNDYRKKASEAVDVNKLKTTAGQWGEAAKTRVQDVDMSKWKEHTETAKESAYERAHWTQQRLSELRTTSRERLSEFSERSKDLKGELGDAAASKRTQLGEKLSDLTEEIKQSAPKIENVDDAKKVVGSATRRFMEGTTNAVGKIAGDLAVMGSALASGARAAWRAAHSVGGVAMTVLRFLTSVFHAFSNGFLFLKEMFRRHPIFCIFLTSTLVLFLVLARTNGLLNQITYIVSGVKYIIESIVGNKSN
eukprot:PhM_4_TR3150/c0_g1_i1/m.14712